MHVLLYQFYVQLTRDITNFKTPSKKFDISESSIHRNSLYQKHKSTKFVLTRFKRKFKI